MRGSVRGLCGWFSEQPDPDAAHTLQRMLAVHPEAASSARSTIAPHAALAAFGAPLAPRLVELNGFWLAAVGHPRLRSAGRNGNSLTDLAEAIRGRGKAALADIGGDFALVAWDSATRRGLVAVDRLGAHPIVFARAAGTLVFASTADAVAALPQVDRRLSNQALFDYLYYHVCPGPSTAFVGLQRIEPAHCIEFGGGLATAPVPYWSLQFHEDHRTSFADFKQEFRSLLGTAVDEAADAPNCGSFLSGGTDSSTISGMLSRATGKPARAFSIGFDSQGFDETGYARIAARHFALEHHEYYVTPGDVVDAVPKIAAAYDQPFGNASAIPTYYCARFAREHGVERMLAGDGGDELFGGNDRYARHYLLSLYGRVPAPIRQALIEPLLLSAPGIGGVPPLRKLRSYVTQAKPAMPWRYESYNLLQHLGAAAVLTPEFLATVDVEHPRRLLQDTFAPFAADSLINQMLGIDFRFTLTDNDLPKVTQMCSLAGIDVGFPLLDDRLIEFSTRLPADMKLRRTQLRWFYKQALSDFLPDEIIRKKKHGFGLPVGQWLGAHKPLLDLAMSAVEPLVSRGIVRRGFVDDLVTKQMKDDPGYYGVMLWLLMMLGLWLKSRSL